MPPDEDELFAELKAEAAAEIDGDEGPLRELEQGLKELKREYEGIRLHKLCRIRRSDESLTGRMKHSKQMREDMHGKYAELTDEEIVRTSA